MRNRKTGGVSKEAPLLTSGGQVYPRLPAKYWQLIFLDLRSIFEGNSRRHTESTDEYNCEVKNMYLQYKSRPQEEVSDSIGLLISILVRYPEVGTINYDPIKQNLKFTFIFSCVLEDADLVNFKKTVLDSIEIYNNLEGRTPTNIEVSYYLCDSFTMFEISRDVGTLTQEEISLTIELVYINFRQNLVTEKNDYLLEEDLLMQEELIEQMLENLKVSFPEKNLIAFREEGRVLVFNK